MQTLRIFISSPGDVAEERQIAGKVIERLQGKYWSFVRLDDVFWEKKVIRSTAHYQDELVQPGECEIVFGILWSRLGSPLPGKFQDGGGDTTTGTEWELENAFDAYEKSKAELLLLGKTEKETQHLVKPHIVVYRRNSPRLPSSDSGQEVKAATQEKMLAGYLSSHFHNADEHHTIKRPITQYASLEEFEAKLSANLEELILRMIPALKPGFEPPPISGSPFKGLRAFEFADSDRYFGRNREIREIQQRLITSANKGLPFLLIYGGSGYGKSSLMRAGLAPVLTRPGGSRNEIAGWRRVALQPAKGDGSLIERLSRSILLQPTPDESAHARLHPHYPLTGLAELSTYTNEDTTLWDSAALVRHFADADQRVFAIAAIVETLRSLNLHLLLEIDQLEEIFTIPSFDDVQRSAFLETIAELCATGRVWTVATMRSEFFPRIAEQPELFQLVGKDRGYILSPPDRQSLREIIRYPALAARLDFERRVDEIEIAGEKAKHDYLHDQILADSEGSPDALPLLEFTLQQLYDERDQNENLLTWKSYAAAGGLKGAIAKRATGVFKTLDPVAQEARHQIFAALIHVDPSRGTQTRKRAPLASLKTHPGSETFIQAFLDAHLLITDEDTLSNEPVVTLAHEALISHWCELSSWIKNHYGDILARQRLAEQTLLWIENGKTKSYLLSEARLAEAEQVKSSQLFTLTADQNQLLIDSRKLAALKQRILQSAVFFFAIISIATGFFAWKSNNETYRANEENKRANSLNNEASEKAHGSAREAFENSNDIPKGIAYLLDALRYDPENRSAIQDANLHLTRTLTDELLPHYLPYQSESPLRSAEFTGEGINVLLADSTGNRITWKPIEGTASHEKGHTIPLGISSPNNQWAILLENNKAHLYNVKLQQKRELRGGEDIVYCADFSPDSLMVVTGGHDGVLRLWSIPSGELIQTKDSSGGSPIAIVKFNHDGSQLAVSRDIWRPREDGTEEYTTSKSSFQIWKTNGPTLLKKSDDMDFQITCFEFNKKGTQVVTGTSTGEAFIWDIKDLNRPVGKTISSGSSLEMLRLSPDDEHLLTIENTGIARIWNSTPARRLANPTEIVVKKHIEGGYFNEKGSLFLLRDKQSVSIWSSDTREQIGEIINPVGEVLDAQFKPRSSDILLVTNREIALYRSTSGDYKRESSIVVDRNNLINPVFIPDGSELLIPTQSGGIERWDSKLQRQIEIPFGPKDGIAGFSVSEDSLYAVVAGYDGNAQLWNLRTAQKIGNPSTFDLSGSVRILFQPHGDHVGLVANGVKVWLHDNQKGLMEVKNIPEVSDLLAFSADGKFMITRSSQKKSTGIDIYQTSNLTLSRKIPHQSAVNSSSFDSSGKRLLTSTQKGTTQIWDTENGHRIGESWVYSEGTNSVLVNRDFSRLLIVTEDGTAILWNIENFLNATELSQIMLPLYGRRVALDGRLVEIPGEERLEMIDALVRENKGDSPFSQIIQFYFSPKV